MECDHDADAGVDRDHARRQRRQTAPEARHQHQCAGDQQHAPPNQRQRPERDQLAEDGSEAPQDDAEMNLPIGARNRRHVPILDNEARPRLRRSAARAAADDPIGGDDNFAQ
jgi:hypothetical protein